MTNIINDLDRIRLIQASIERCRLMLNEFREEHGEARHTTVFKFSEGEMLDAIKEGQDHIKKLKRVLYN